MALNKDEHYEEKWVGRKLLYRLHPAFDWREMPYDELCNKICDLENELKRVRAKTSEREQANENIPLVTNRTLKNGRELAYLQGYRKRAIMSELTYDHTSEMNAKKEFNNWHLNLYSC